MNDILQNKIFKILSISIFIIWGIANFYLVGSNVFLKILGGSAILFYLIPFLLFFLYKYEGYKKNIFQVLILYIGFITLSLLTYYSQHAQLKMPFIFGVLFAYLPFLIVIPPFLTLLNMLFKPPQEVKNQDDKKYISNAIAMNNLILFTSLALGAAIIFIWTNGEKIQLTKAIYILLGSTIFATSLLIIIWRKHKDEEINYFFEIF